MTSPTNTPQALSEAQMDGIFLERYWQKVDKRGENDCWPWLASNKPNGYGSMWCSGRLYKATHIALAIEGIFGSPGLVVMHSCDNPPCVNPKHLRWGTMKENTHDSIAKGRKVNPPREKHKLNPEQIAAIAKEYDAGASAPKLGKKYGVDSKTIYRNIQHLVQMRPSLSKGGRKEQYMCVPATPAQNNNQKEVK